MPHQMVRGRKALSRTQGLDSEHGGIVKTVQNPLNQARKSHRPRLQSVF